MEDVLNKTCVNVHPGHSRCYTKHQKCIYNLTSDTQMLMYCRNGQAFAGL